MTVMRVPLVLLLAVVVCIFVLSLISINNSKGNGGAVWFCGFFRESEKDGSKGESNMFVWQN